MKDLNNEKEPDMVSEGRAFHVEGTASDDILRWYQVLCILQREEYEKTGEVDRG